MGTSTDVEAIEKVVAAVEHSQQNELVDDFLALFREDAIWTTGHGRLLVGRDAIADFTRQALPGAMTDLTVSYEVVHVQLLRPEVAAVKVRQRYRDRDGRATGDEGSPLYVMTRQDGRWLLAACQNTLVVDS